jgi:hypothetical protein
MRAAWLAIIVAGFVAGAGTVLLADPGTSEPRVLVTPAGASQSGTNTAINGQHIHGVKAGDIAAEAVPDKPLSRADRDMLAAQLTQARSTAEQYPTVQDALNGGYIIAGGFAPGSGAHYVKVNGSGFAGQNSMDINHPGSLIYEGTNPDSKIIGLMYLGFGAGGKPPEGFVGPNDHWHRHSDVCIKYGAGGIQVPFPADADVTVAQCQAVHGNFMKITTWMVHAWVVPGWESPLGVFSHDNPNIRCADGTYNTNKSGFCQGL